MAVGRGNVLSGARARFSINGVKMMYATNVDVSEEFTQEPVDPLDQLETAEHVTTGYRVTLSAQFVRVITNPIKLRDGVRVFPRLSDALNSEELVVTIEDSVTGLVLATIEGVRASRYRKNIGARGIVLTDCEFVARKLLDESEIV